MDTHQSGDWGGDLTSSQAESFMSEFDMTATAAIAPAPTTLVHPLPGAYVGATGAPPYRLAVRSALHKHVFAEEASQATTLLEQEQAQKVSIVCY